MLWGQGNGTFSVDAARPRVIAADLPQRLLADDFNGDGRAELLTGSAERLLLQYNPPAGFASTSLSLFPATGAPHVDIKAFATGAFNSDAGRDLAVLSYQSTPTPAGGFFRIRPYRYTSHPQLPFALNGDALEVPIAYPASTLAATDFNGDGKGDLVVGIEGDSSVSLALLAGRGDFSFDEPLLYQGNFDAAAVFAADFSNDGKPDLAVLDCSHGELGGF